MGIIERKKRIMMAQLKKSRLPKEYTEIQWLDTVNTNPYIDTGLTITDETDVELRYYNTRNEAFVFGARKGSGNSPYFNMNIQLTPSSPRFDCYNNIANNKNIGEHFKYADVTFTFKNRIVTYYSHTYLESVTQDYTSFSFNGQNRNIYLFAICTNNSASVTNQLGILRIYYARFWTDGVLTRDFVPGIRKSDNEPGMYDLVTQQFYTKQGTGNFVPGPKI